MSLRPPSPPSSTGSDAQLLTASGRLLQSIGGYQPDGSGIENQATPIQTYLSTGGLYEDDDPGNVFHLASYVENTGSRATVAVFGGAKGEHVFGGNFVAYSDGADDTAIGVEIDFGNVNVAGGTAHGLLIKSAGGNIGGSGGENYIQLHAADSSPTVDGIVFHTSADQTPVTNALIRTNGAVSCTYGIDLSSASFSARAINLGPGHDVGISSTTGSKIGTSASLIGFWGNTPVAKRAAFTQTYATADRTLGAYAADDESAAYTGAADSEAKLADLNALRVAYENLRSFTEDVAQAVNALIDDHQAMGLCA